MSNFSEVLANRDNYNAYQKFIKGGWKKCERKIEVKIGDLEAAQQRLEEVVKLDREAERTVERLNEAIAILKSQIR
jgi:hypothetical protein